MGIIVNLDVMMAKRKISLTELANQVDLTQANLSILKNNKAKAIRFSTLESICEVLHCQPGDILEYVEDTKEEETKENLRGGDHNAGKYSSTGNKFNKSGTDFRAECSPGSGKDRDCGDKALAGAL